MNGLKNKLLLLFVLSLFISAPTSAFAQGIDMLGEITKPLWGPAKDKANDMRKYLWLQPYGGYATGKGTLSSSTGSTSLKNSGAIIGARAGLKLFDSLRAGVDYTMQFSERDETVTNTLGVATNQKVSSKDTMFGFSGSFAVPYTPLQAYGAKYIKATLGSDSSKGDGWGAGVSFVLKNPFILIVERRSLKYDSAANLLGQTTQRKVEQYFIGLSFLLL